MLSARGVAYFALFLSVASAVVCVVGLAGVQRECEDDTSNLASTFAQSGSFTTCAKRYSLNWWTWVLQEVSFIAIPVALTRGRLPDMGLPLLLAITALLVLQTVVCTRTIDFRSNSPDGQSDWSNTMLAGFIMAAASSWLLIFSLSPQLRAEEARRDQLDAGANKMQA
ncbi:transporter SEO1 [Chlorella sorokiniana]|jgi:hypothetical protein|uniref:Transporter SEO1 n=1 Tax=Chlorella sorokiniana TaxID=3076 RepID=A0A2P6TUF3_CHLSO|nr:transporter SEO1 [Chlorella sorokiniana]|eukprot:PRW57656.1 transporter SEO1 [Chlorella sorokiniana]